MSYTGFTLRYECDCGRRVPASKRACPDCNRPNPDFQISPSFMAFPSHPKRLGEKEYELKKNLERLGKE